MTEVYEDPAEMEDFEEYENNSSENEKNRDETKKMKRGSKKIPEKRF